MPHWGHIQSAGPTCKQKKLNFTMSTSKPGTQKATDSAANDDAKADAATETETENDDE